MYVRGHTIMCRDESASFIDCGKSKQIALDRSHFIANLFVLSTLEADITGVCNGLHDCKGVGDLLQADGVR